MGEEAVFPIRERDEVKKLIRGLEDKDNCQNVAMLFHLKEEEIKKQNFFLKMIKAMTMRMEQ